MGDLNLIPECLRDCYVSFLDDIGCPLEDLSCQCTNNLEIYNSNMAAVADFYTCIAFENCGTYELADMYSGDLILEYCAPYLAGTQTTRTSGPSQTDDDSTPEETQVETPEGTGIDSQGRNGGDDGAESGGGGGRVHPGIVAAIALGILLLALAIVGYIFFYIRRRKKSTTSTPSTTDHTIVGQQQSEAKDVATTQVTSEADAYSPQPPPTLLTSSPSLPQSSPPVYRAYPPLTPHVGAPPPFELYAATSPQHGTFYHEMPPHNPASEMAAADPLQEMPSVPYHASDAPRRQPDIP